MKKIKVQCTFEIEVEVPDDADEYFIIEENGCPATGEVGMAFDKAYEHHNNNDTCWACALKANNKII